MTPEIFSKRLKEAMQKKKMKQVDILRLAESAGIKLGKSHISQYLSGKSVPREGVMAFLAKTLDVSVSYLKGEDAPTLTDTGDVPMKFYKKSAIRRVCVLRFA